MAFQFRDEAIEEDLNRTFRSQGQGRPEQYYNLSQTVVPTYSINDVAEGSGLPERLQQSWDYATDNKVLSNGNSNLTSVPGFYKVSLIASTNDFARASVTTIARVRITDGITPKNIWIWSTVGQAGTAPEAITTADFVIFLRSGDTLNAQALAASETLNIWYRQIATVNGTLVNPLGYSAA